MIPSVRPMSIEEPLKVIPNIYELIHRAAHRAHQLADGATPKTDIGTSGYPMSALKEIAAGHTDFSEQQE